jgi:hypothetical protein
MINQLTELMAEHGDLEVLHGPDSIEASDEIVYCRPSPWTSAPSDEGSFDIRSW